MTDILVRTGSLSFAYPERASTLFRRAALREIVKHVDLAVPRGSVLGLGTDIGGSIRIPAGFNGLYGLRPSHGRMPYNMLANSMEGQETIHSGSPYNPHLRPDNSCWSNCPFGSRYSLLFHNGIAGSAMVP